MGEDAVFSVTASVLPNQNIKVRYTAVSTGGNFLERVGSQSNPIRTATVRFFAQGANQPIVGTLIVPTIVDPTNTPGSITITLVDDINPNNYVISQTQSETEGMVNILKVSVPELSVISVSNTINEGEMAKFIVTSSIQPESTLDVEYTPTDVSGSYLDATANPTGVEKMETLRFEQRFGSPDWTAEINLRTRNEDRNTQNGGDISLLLSPSDDPTSFVIASAPNNLATVAIQDTDIPIISIQDASDTLVGRTATFTLVSDIQPSQALNVTYIVRETEGNFLDSSITPGDEQSKLFTFDTPTDQGFTTTLEINTEADANSESGKISVTIFDDFTNSPQLYTISPNVANRSAEVSVKPLPVPTVSFNNSHVELDEGASNASVTIVANENPLRTAMESFNVKYTLKNTSSKNFLNKTITNSMTEVLNDDGTFSRTETVNFTNISDPTMWTATLPVPLLARDNLDSYDGEIQITLDTPEANAGYVVTTTSADSILVTVKNLDIPPVGIVSRTRAPYGLTTTITLQTDLEPKAPISIRYIPYNRSRTNWIDESDGLAGRERFDTTTFMFVFEGGDVRMTEPLTFERVGTNIYRASFTVLTKKDPLNETGSFEVHLQDDTNIPRNYKLDALSHRQRTNVQVGPPTNPPIYITAGYFNHPTNFTNNTFIPMTKFSEGSTIKLVLRTHTDPNISKQPVKLIATNMKGNFLDTSLVNSGTVRVEELIWYSASFAGGPGGGMATWIAIVTIPQREADGIDSDHGEIKIALQAGDNYRLPTAADQPGEVLITINDDVTPEISISNAPEISPTNNAQFVLESDLLPWEPVSIRYTATESGTNFLGTTTPEQTVTFTQPTPDHPITGILSIPTIQDASNDSGTITITILDDVPVPANSPKDYTFSTDTNKRSATVAIKKTGLKPTLSIKPSDEDAVETTSNGMAKFIVTASYNPVNNVDLSYTVTQPNGDFLSSGQATTYRPSAVFRQVSPSTDYTYDIDLSLRAKNEMMKSMGK